MTTDDQSDEKDHLYRAGVLLEECDGAVDYEQGSSFALKSIAHTLLWMASTIRDQAARDAAEQVARDLRRRETQAPYPPDGPLSTF